MANVDLFELEQNVFGYYNIVSFIPPSPHLKTIKPICHWTPLRVQLLFQVDDYFPIFGVKLISHLCLL
jgi:hypothetical protein